MYVVQREGGLGGCTGELYVQSPFVAADSCFPVFPTDIKIEDPMDSSSTTNRYSTNSILLVTRVAHQQSGSSSRSSAAAAAKSHRVPISVGKKSAVIFVTGRV